MRRALHCDAPSNNQLPDVQAFRRIALSCTAVAFFVGIASPKTGILHSHGRNKDEGALEFLLRKNTKHHFLLGTEESLGK